MKSARIAWGITGAGDKIRETISEMEKIKGKYSVEISVFVSKAGEQVLRMYKIYDDIKDSFERFSIEVNANTPFLSGALYLGKYEALIIAPATSNTVAKISNCIGDSLLSNSALQALKAYIPVYILPVDLEVGELETETPSGRKLKLRVRKEDVAHVNRLRETDGVHIMGGPSKIEENVKRILDSGAK